MKKEILLFLLSLVLVHSNKRIIWDEKQTVEELKQSVNIFNKWMSSILLNNPFELRLNAKDELRVYASRDINSDETLTILGKNLLSNEKLYEASKYTAFIKELEEKYGYDEVTYFSILIISEYFNPTSIFRPILDIIPKKSFTPVYNYWNIASVIEPEIIGTNIIRKLVDYKIQSEQRAKNIVNGLLKNHKDLFDENIFNEENIEWSIYIYDSMIQYAGYRSMIIPYLDFMEITSEETGEIIKTSSSLAENNLEYSINLQFKNYKISKNQEIKRNIKMNGDFLLTYHGIVLDNNEEYDCLSLGLSFSERTDDKYSNERIKFFGKFFLFDRNHYDLIEECININSFNRRVLFFFYTLMMDSNDLKKSDPKRDRLEEDLIIIKFTKENFEAMESLNKHTIEEEKFLIDNEKNDLIKKLKAYKLQQRVLLKRHIEYLNKQYMLLLKDESL